MKIRYVCQGCRASLGVEDSFMGRQVKCPKCHAVGVVPAPEPVRPVSTNALVPVALVFSSPPEHPVALVSQQPAPGIFILCQQEQKGPFARSQLQAMWNSGAITADTMYWHEGMPQWLSITEFFEQFVPTIPNGAPAIAAQVEVGYDRTRKTFRGTLPLLMRLAVKAIHDLGYKLDNANESVGIVTFQTGMTWGSWSGALCSLNFEEVGPSAFRVSGAGKQNVSGGQILALNLFGEAKGRADKVIRLMQELAGRLPSLVPA